MIKKLLITVCLFVLILVATVDAGHYWSETGPGVPLNDVYGYDGTWLAAGPGGRAFFGDGKQWNEISIPSGKVFNIRAVFTTGTAGYDDGYCVGDNGNWWYLRSGAWNQIIDPDITTDMQLIDVWAFAPTYEFAICGTQGGAPLFLYFNGSYWRKVPVINFTGTRFLAIHGGAIDELLVVGESDAYWFNGSSLVRLAGAVSGANCIFSIDSTNHLIGGDDVWYWNGISPSGWTSLGYIGPTVKSIWAAGPYDVYAATDHDIRHTIDGTNWSIVYETTKTITSMWGTGTCIIKAVCSDGTLITGPCAPIVVRIQKVAEDWPWIDPGR